MAEVIEIDLTRRYSLDDFPEDDAEPDRRDDRIEPGEPVSRDELRRLVKLKGLRRRVLNGPMRGEDRSDFVWHTARELLACGVPEDRVVAILVDPQYKVSRHCLEQSDPVRAASRAVTRQQAEKPDAEGFDAVFEQAQEDVAAALGTEETATRYAAPLFEPATALLARVYPPTPWLVRGLVTEGGVAVVATEPKSAKTWLGTEIAIAVASGTRVCGEFETKQRRVAYFYAEDHGVSVQARLRALARGRGLSPHETTSNLHVQARGTHLDLRRDEDLAWLVASVRYMGGVGLLVLDPLRDVHSGRENESDDMSEVFARLRTLSDLLNCTVLIVHHTIKSSADSRGRRHGQNMRGSSAIHGAIDSGIYLSSLEVDDARTTFTNTVNSEVKGARSAPAFDLTLRIRDDLSGVAESAAWTVDGKETAEEAVDPRRQERREQILASLRAAGKPLSANAIIQRDGETWVKGTKPSVLAEIRAMAREDILRQTGMKRYFVTGEGES